MCVTGEGWREDLLSPWRKVLNQLSTPDEQKAIVRRDAVDAVYWARWPHRQWCLSNVGFCRCWLLSVQVLFPNWHLLYLQRYLSRLASKHLFEADWNGFFWNGAPLLTLAPYPSWVAIGCPGGKCSTKMLSVSFLSYCRLWFLEALTRALEGAEAEEETQTLPVGIPVGHVHQWSLDSFLKSLVLGFLPIKGEIILFEEVDSPPLIAGPWQIPKEADIWSPV